MHPLSVVAVILLLSSVAFPQLPPSDPTVSAELNTRELQPGQQAVLAIVVDIPPGLHAQSHTPSDKNYIEFEVTILPTGNVEFFEPIYPPGNDHFYPVIGKLNIYTGKVVVYVPLVVKADAANGPVSISGKMRYQVCDDVGTCLPPQTMPVVTSNQHRSRPDRW